VVVVGGGLIGAALAYELVGRGAPVSVIDAAHPGRATDAGAGILSAATMLVDEAPWWDLASSSGAHYPALLARLAGDGVETGPAQYASCGLLSVVLRKHEDQWFQPFADLVQRRTPDLVSEVSAGEARSMFPPLGPIHRVLHCPGAARVDGRGMAELLREAARARGVQFVAGSVTGVVGAVADGASGPARSVRFVTVDGQADVPCAALVVAGGAWSAAVGEWLDFALPITPTKGQIVHLGVPADTGGWPIVQPLLSHYLVPWPDGRVACGGTFEADAGFSTTVTAAGVQELLREGLAVAPGLAGAEYLTTRVGLRPSSLDDRPIIGAIPGWGNVWAATGHGANGLLLGPYSASIVADLVMGEAHRGRDSQRWSPFAPARFT
jgi:D-amino-acid dehydrogenase